MLCIAACPSVSSASPEPFRDGPLTCSVPIVYPVKVSPREKRSTANVAKPRLPTNGMSNIDVGGDLRNDFALSAAFTLPRTNANRGLFYTNWIILLKYPSGGMIQIELMRWKKYDYRQEIGLTWSLPGHALQYRDTGVFLSNAPHRLGIALRGGAIALLVDGKPVCHAAKSSFFAESDILYYQIGTEVLQVGDRPTGTVSDIRLKRDADLEAVPLKVTCVYRGNGVSWEPAAGGTFLAGGVFDATERSRFTGIAWGEPCRW
jgi:hypothetical protein